MQTGIRALLVALVFTALIADVHPVHAQIYKWVDDKGVTHYDASPPPGASPAKAQTLNIPATSMASSSSAVPWQEKDSAFQTRYDKRKAKEAQEDADAKTAQMNRQHICNYARNELNGVLSTATVYRLDEQGNRVYMSDAQRDQYIEQLRGKVAGNCNG